MYTFTFFNNNSALIPLQPISQGILNLWLCWENLMDKNFIDRDNFWKISLLKKFDDGEFGNIGYITNFFRYFENITDFKLTYAKDTLCLFRTMKQYKITSFCPYISILRSDDKTFGQAYTNKLKNKTMTLVFMLFKEF